MIDLSFEAMAMRRDGSIAPVRQRFLETPGGFVVERPELPPLELGPGYRLLESLACGVCATDLARSHLPFDLPQVLGHEVLARDPEGRRVVVEINASCLARRLTEPCGLCRAGRPTHCERRLTLGIDGLPGGFGPFILAPEGAILPVPDEIDDETAILLEPFAAALHAVDRSGARGAEDIVVLGPRRLGMLLIAALAARRREGLVAGRIRALVRRPELGELALELGADRFDLVGRDRPAAADLVFDTSGNPEALGLALDLARRELHLKSTHGRGAGGLEGLTALVVDELELGRLDEELRLPPAATGIVLIEEGRARGLDAGDLADLAAARPALGRRAVVRDDAAIDRVIRPLPAIERALVAPGSRILLDPAGRFGSEVARAVLAGLVVGSSRCGDFARALALLRRDPELRRLGRRLVNQRRPRSELAEALRLAASPEALKVMVQ